MHRNAREIAAASSSRCYNRAISTMRLALGYGKGLPKGWKLNGATKFKDVVNTLGKAFPSHKVVLCVTPNHYKYLATNNYLISDIQIESDMFSLVDKYQDEYLWAFNYRNNDNSDGHIVIGLPWDDKGNAPMRFGFVFGVQIQDV